MSKTWAQQKETHEIDDAAKDRQQRKPMYDYTLLYVAWVYILRQLYNREQQWTLLYRLKQKTHVTQPAEAKPAVHIAHTSYRTLSYLPLHVIPNLAFSGSGNVLAGKERQKLEMCNGIMFRHCSHSSKTHTYRRCQFEGNSLLAPPSSQGSIVQF